MKDFIIVVITILVCFWLLSVGVQAGEIKLQKEAIAHGYATYEKETGNFVWK